MYPGSAFDSPCNSKIFDVGVFRDRLKIGNQIQQSSLRRAPVLTDRQSASDIRMAEIEIVMATMFLVLNLYFKIKKRNMHYM